MTRRLLTLLTGMVILVAGITLAADEPGSDPAEDQPVRLKKKKKPDMVDPGKKEPGKEEPGKIDPPKPPMGEDKPAEPKKEKVDDEPVTKDGEPLDPEEDESEVFERIAKNMKASEERIVNKEL